MHQDVICQNQSRPSSALVVLCFKCPSQGQTEWLQNNIMWSMWIYYFLVIVLNW